MFEATYGRDTLGFGSQNNPSFHPSSSLDKKTKVFVSIVFLQILGGGNKVRVDSTPMGESGDIEINTILKEKYFSTD